MHYGRLVFLLASCLAFATRAAPTTASHVYTPYGRRPANNVRLVPDGKTIVFLRWIIADYPIL
ncbi:hypothetical protein DL93DRAFT_2084216 [Clavulina sp. PMI_390]|nr:hypothetical protein DL93DRAFT_2084216 [Clavulina sp. PMI_390]